ncbi:MAG: hypothetical protein WB626_04320 [Bacteroidota bacterium]
MRLAGNLLLFVAVLAISLVVCDLYLQFAGIQTPMETTIDPVLGPAYIPGTFISRFNEGFFLGSVNAYGYMGPSVSPRREGAERRVLLLGDSYVLGHTVLPRHYFGRRLEQELTGRLGTPVRALNFGKADFNLVNMYHYYSAFAGSFDHDLALFFAGEGDLMPARQTVSALYPFMRLQGDSLVVDVSFRQSGAYGFYRSVEPLFVRSALLRLGFNTYKMVLRRELLRVVLDKFAPRYDPAVEESREEHGGMPAGMPRINRVILRRLAADPRNVLVLQTPLDPEVRAEVDSSRLPVLDLGRYLEELRAGGEDPTYWPVTGMRGHWNHAAHGKIGVFLAGAILSRGLAGPGTAPGN